MWQEIQTVLTFVFTCGICGLLLQGGRLLQRLDTLEESYANFVKGNHQQNMALGDKIDRLHAQDLEAHSRLQVDVSGHSARLDNIERDVAAIKTAVYGRRS